MLVYRVEMENGVGPFMAGRIWDYYEHNAVHMPGYSSFSDEVREKLYEGSSYVCGFTSMDSVKKWFIPDIKYLSDFGVGIYESEDVIECPEQVIFRRIGVYKRKDWILLTEIEVS